jgi:thioesterase domain-containing protein
VDHRALEQYLHEHIPLSRAMGVTVVAADENGVTLSAPLAPNINHRETVFGGSASAVAILAAWSLIHVRLTRAGIHSRVVIQRNTMSYDRPIAGDFSASSAVHDPATWDRFVRQLTRKNRARITVTAVLHCDGERVGALEGDFVALGAGTA